MDGELDDEDTDGDVEESDVEESEGDVEESEGVALLAFGRQELKHNLLGEIIGVRSCFMTNRCFVSTGPPPTGKTKCKHSSKSRSCVSSPVFRGLEKEKLIKPFAAAAEIFCTDCFVSGMGSE